MNSNYNSNKNKTLVWEQFKELLSEIPFFIRFIIIIKLLLFFLNIFIKYISFYLSNIPSYIIYHYQFWRLITTSFITTNIINMIIGFIVWIKDAISFERSLGTIRYILVFTINSIFINVIYCLITYWINSISKNKINYLEMNEVNNNGIWPIIICDITLLCLNNPNSYIEFLYRPCPIKAKYYPIFIIVLISLINKFRMNYEIISGFLYGIIYYYIFQNRLYFSDEFIKKLENSFCCKYLIGFNGFIKIDNINNSPPTSGDVHMTNSFDNNQKAFNPFSGKGIQVGPNNDYIAVNEQNQNNNLGEINS